jgi:hypothetical protein
LFAALSVARGGAKPYHDLFEGVNESEAEVRGSLEGVGLAE